MIEDVTIEDVTIELRMQRGRRWWSRAASVANPTADKRDCNADSRTTCLASNRHATNDHRVSKKSRSQSRSRSRNRNRSNRSRSRSSRSRSRRTNILKTATGTLVPF
jgi:hypothetical protein